MATSNLQVSMVMSVCEQRFWQLSQVGFKHCGCIIGMEVACLKIYICPSIEHFPQGGLPKAVAWHTEQPLHMKV